MMKFLFRDFAQFFWRRNIGNFENVCKKIKEEHLVKLDSIIEEEVKSIFLSDFSQLIPKVGRQLVKESGVLTLAEWDIANVVIFNSIRKENNVQYQTEEEILQAHRGIIFSDDHQALVIWSI